MTRSALTCRALLLLTLAAGHALWAQAPLQAAASSPTNAPAGTSSAAPRTSKPVSPHDAQTARDAYLAGAKLLERNDLPAAQREFERAADLDPATVSYTLGARLALEHRLTALVQQAGKARLLGQDKQAEMLLAQARLLDPENAIILQHAVPGPIASSFEAVPDGRETETDAPDPNEPWRNKQPGLAGPIQLHPSTTHHSLHLRGDLRTVMTQAFTQFGIRATFDDSVSPAATPQGLRFDLDDTTYAQAAPILLSMGRVFATPLDPTSVFIAVDNPANRGKFEHLFQETLYTPGLNPQQMGEVANVIRQVFDVRQLSMGNNAGAITLRAPAGTLDALNRTLSDLLDGSAEVLVDLRLYSVDITRNRNIGPNVPQQFGVYNVASAAQSLVSSNQTAVNQAVAQGLITLGSNPTNNLLLEAGFLVESGLAQSSLLTDTIGIFGKGLTLTGITESGSAGLTLSLNSSDTRALDDVQVRVSDRQTATFRAGTRYPITTSTYSTGLSGTNSAALAGASINGVSVSSLLNQYLGGNSAGTTIPQIQYEDLGITLKTTPNVQSSGNVTLHLDFKIEALAGSALNNIPILVSRQFVSDVTLGEGQTALMISSLSKTESTVVNGIPGLGELPGFQSITADNNRERDSSEIVVLLTPRLVRHRQTLTVGPRIPVSPSLDSSS